MNSKVLGVALLIVGAVVLFYGLQAGSSLFSEAKEAIDGTPTDRSLGLILGGGAVAAAGLGLLLKGRR